jgi:hypothetical protein
MDLTNFPPAPDVIDSGNLAIDQPQTETEGLSLSSKIFIFVIELKMNILNQSLPDRSFGSTGTLGVSHVGIHNGLDTAEAGTLGDPPKSIGHASELPRGNWRSEVDALGSTIRAQVSELARLYHISDDEITLAVIRQVLHSKTAMAESGQSIMD